MNAFALIFADIYKPNRMESLTAVRSISSVPFGCRYRLIDFTLSSLVASKIPDIGIITQFNYNSLMDHLGWGKDWDLNRKNGGLKVLTPMAEESDIHIYRNKFEAMYSVEQYIQSRLEEYCILSDGNMVYTFDFDDLLNFHVSKGADITVVYRKSVPKANETQIIVDEHKRAYDALYHSQSGTKECDMLARIFVIKKSHLLNLIKKGMTLGWEDIAKDYISKNFNRLLVYAYEIKNYYRPINNIEEYYNVSMELLDENIRKELFLSGAGILTRIKDSAPATYGSDCVVKNSLIADGTVIDGTVENSLIFRDVKIEKGVTVKNSIIFQNSVIKSGSYLDYVISDKEVTIGENNNLRGVRQCPFIIAKGKTL